MKNLDPFKVSGPDKIQSRFLKLMAEELSAGVTLIFRASIHLAKIPNAWRDALVSSLYKSGKTDRSNPKNYRLISLTSVSCKMLEHIIHSDVIEHLDHNNIITDAQHGFRSKRSCETQLIKSVRDLVKSLNDSEQIDSFLRDFSKAFDKVSHRKLCLKLQHHGIRGKLLKWVEDFLYNRTQKVVVSGEESLSVSVTSGVLQGTVVEPMICQIPPPLLRRPLNGQNLLSLTKVFFMLPKSLSTKECPTELSF